MINTKLIIRIFKVVCLIGLILMLMNSCDESNPMQMEEPCCVTPPYHEVMSMEQHTMVPGELPQPMILIVNIHLWFHYKVVVFLVDIFVVVHW